MQAVDWNIFICLNQTEGSPGRGCLKWEDTFAGLKAVNFKGTMTLESFIYVDDDIAGGLALCVLSIDQPEDILKVGIPS